MSEALHQGTFADKIHATLPILQGQTSAQISRTIPKAKSLPTEGREAGFRFCPGAEAVARPQVGQVINHLFHRVTAIFQAHSNCEALSPGKLTEDTPAIGGAGGLIHEPKKIPCLQRTGRTQVVPMVVGTFGKGRFKSPRGFTQAGVEQEMPPGVPPSKSLRIFVA